MAAYAYGPYHYGHDGTNDPMLAKAISGFKMELIYNGLSKNVDPLVPVFGDAMRNRVKELQASRGLTVDGAIGFKTAKELFRKRIEATEDKYELPRATLGKKLSLESGFDPIAIGYVDPQDTGIAQINLGAHPDIQRDDALDPAFSINWAGRYIRGNAEIITNGVDIIKAARAAYNIGTYNATKWLLDSFPTSGGPLLNGQDVYERATKYIELIDKQVW